MSDRFDPTNLLFPNSDEKNEFDQILDAKNTLNDSQTSMPTQQVDPFHAFTTISDNKDVPGQILPPVEDASNLFSTVRISQNFERNINSIYDPFSDGSMNTYNPFDEIQSNNNSNSALYSSNTTVPTSTEYVDPFQNLPDPMTISVLNQFNSDSNKISSVDNLFSDTNESPTSDTLNLFQAPPPVSIFSDCSNPPPVDDTLKLFQAPPPLPKTTGFSNAFNDTPINEQFGSSSTSGSVSGDFNSAVVPPPQSLLIVAQSSQTPNKSSSSLNFHSNAINGNNSLQFSQIPQSSNYNASAGGELDESNIKTAQDNLTNANASSAVPKMPLYNTTNSMSTTAPIAGNSPHNQATKTFNTRLPPQRASIAASNSLPQTPQQSPGRTGQLNNISSINATPKPVEVLLREFLEIAHVQPNELLRIDTSEITLNTLTKLYWLQKWNTLENCSKKIVESSASNPHIKIEAQSWLLLGLMKQNRIEELENELNLLGNLEDEKYNFETYPEMHGDNRGSFVPIRLLFTFAMFPRFKNNYQDHDQRMYSLIEKISLLPTSQPQSNANCIRKWNQIIKLSLASSFVDRRKYELALSICFDLAKSITSDEKEEIITLGSRIGRLYLQMGCTNHAEKIFNSVNTIATSEGIPDHSPRLLLNKGLILFAQNHFKEAMDTFELILQLSDDNEEDSGIAEEPSIFMDDGDLVTSAANNMSICGLYSCEVNHAVDVLESTIRLNPARYLNCSVVFNLSTLYDLVYDNPNSTVKKEMIKQLAQIYKIEHIDTNSFRI